MLIATNTNIIDRFYQLMINAFEIVKTIECQQRFQILDTLIKNKDNLQFYFYSLVKKKILRKKQENIGVEFINDYASKLAKKSIITDTILINYKQNEDKKAQIKVIKPSEVQKLITNKKQHESWMSISLDKIKGKYQLVKAKWTQNYCICEEFILNAKEQNLGLNLSISMKESIGIICREIAKGAERYSRGKIKSMDILFLKPAHLTKVYFIFAQKMVMAESVIINISFGKQSNISQKQKQEIEELQIDRQLEQKKKESQQKQYHSITQSRIKHPNLSFLFCASCRRTDITQYKQIPSHSVYKIQLKHSTAKRSVSQKRNNLLQMYNFSKVCLECYSKYVDQVKKQGKYLESIRPRNTHPVKSRSTSKLKDTSYCTNNENIKEYSSNSRIIEEDNKKVNWRTNRGHRIISLFKTNSKSCVSDSTKVLGYESILDISEISKKRI